LTRALVDGERQLPFPKGRGVCPTCASTVIAKCGKIKTHHWAHESREDCDPWSENIGPWHLAWQNLVTDKHVEVAIGPHRADIVGNAGLVVELQHSPIPPDDIDAREQFYGDMIWVFDATERFPCVPSGDRVFFSFAGTKHIEFCKKKVFFDCGNYLVEVECFTDTFDKFSGFGRLRDQRWFAEQHLSDVLKPKSKAFVRTPNGRLGADRWRGKQPWRLTENPSRWRNPTTGNDYLIPAKSVYLPMNYKWKGHPGSVWSDVIARHSEIANGWTDSDLTEIRTLLTATPMILDGRLRLMPARAEFMKVEQSAATVRRWIANADTHMHAGRIPLLKPSTLDALVKRAEEREIEKYGQPLRPVQKEDPQRKLF
jgi:Competence protein CoiA-like family